MLSFLEDQKKVLQTGAYFMTLLRQIPGCSGASCELESRVVVYLDWAYLDVIVNGYQIHLSGSERL